MRLQVGDKVIVRSEKSFSESHGEEAQTVLYIEGVPPVDSVKLYSTKRGHNYYVPSNCLIKLEPIGE